MPQVKIHIADSMHNENKCKMVHAIRELISFALNIDNKIGQVMLYESEHRANHESRDKNFVFVEVTMYSGRSYELKQKLADLIISEIVKYTKVDVTDINLVYYELNFDNYFGGTTHKYIEDLKKS
jgi:Domain of unknown function (DUF1904).